jgi:hypothetical protein
MKTLAKLFTVFALVLPLLFLVGFGPIRQVLPPEANDFVVYGTSWVLVAAVVLGAVQYWLKPGEDALKAVTAGLVIAGYLLVTNLPSLEQLWPAMPVVVPQILQCVLLFGAVMGFLPGNLAGRVLRVFFAKRQ